MRLHNGTALPQTFERFGGVLALPSEGEGEGEGEEGRILVGGKTRMGVGETMKGGSNCVLPCFAYTVLAPRTSATIDFCIYIHSLQQCF